MPLLGTFDRDALSAPAEALATVMKKHQRYFPIYAAIGPCCRTSSPSPTAATVRGPT